MIIKKKYLEPKEKPQEPQAAPEIIEEVVSVQENVEDITEEEETEEVVEDEIEDIEDLNDFDLSIDDIKFEPREERREGTRRRGYRRTQDRNLLSRAQQEAISIKEAAKTEGYEEGIKKATADLAEVKSKFSEFFSYKDEIFDKVSGCILDISVEIAKKIIKKELEVDRSFLIPMIKEVVEDVNKIENKIMLKVMPKDVELVKDNISEIFKDNNSEAKIYVIPDNNIKEGGVIVETSNGIVDASISTQLSIMEKVLSQTKGDKEE